MKTHHSDWSQRSLQAAAAAATVLAATNGFARDGNAFGATSPPSSKSSNQGSKTPATTQVRVTRATTFLGTDVMASDGRKVGDISDYIFDVSSAPHLKYVVVVTDGFLGHGGDARAVPAHAITTGGDLARLQISSSDFWNVEVMRRDRMRFLANRSDTEQFQRDFKTGDSRDIGRQILRARVAQR